MTLSILLIIAGAIVALDGGKVVYVFGTLTTAGFFRKQHFYQNIFEEMGKNLILHGFAEVSAGVFLFLRTLNIWKEGTMMDGDTINLIGNISMLLLGGGVIIAVMLHLTKSLRSANKELAKKGINKQELGVDNASELAFSYSYRSLNIRIIMSTVLLAGIIALRLL